MSKILSSITRRNFLFLMCACSIYTVIQKLNQELPIANHTLGDNEFIVLAGWVMLKEDLIG